MNPKIAALITFGVVVVLSLLALQITTCVRYDRKIELACINAGGTVIRPSNRERTCVSFQPIQAKP